MWDWPPAGEWLLAEKVSGRHHEYMKALLDGYQRTPVRNYDPATGKLSMWKKPWDPAPADESLIRNTTLLKTTRGELRSRIRKWAAAYNRETLSSSRYPESRRIFEIQDTTP
jgi:hypothetical protein